MAISPGLSFALPGEYRVTAIEGQYLEPDQFMRVDATAVHPIVLAGFFQMVIPLSVAQLIWDRRIWARGYLVCGIALIFYGWYNTAVRTSAIAMAVMGIFALALTFRVGRYLLPVLAGGVVMVFLVFFISPDWLVEKVADTGLFGKVGIPHLGTLWHRVEGMVAGRDLFLDHFFFGVGYGQSDWQQVPYLPGWSVHPTGTIHNAFTEAASELGVMGLLAFVGLWVLAFRYLQKAMGNPDLWPFPQALLVILIGQFVFSSVTFMVRETWLILAMAAAIGRISRRVE